MANEIDFDADRLKRTLKYGIDFHCESYEEQQALARIHESIRELCELYKPAPVLIENNGALVKVISEIDRAIDGDDIEEMGYRALQSLRDWIIEEFRKEESNPRYF